MVGDTATIYFKGFWNTDPVGKKVESLDGVDFQVLVRDVTMDSHPAYTGEKRFVDTAGRVEKFQSKFSRKR